MHILAAQPGGFIQDAGIIASLGQTPANIVILSAADTTLALLASAYENLQKNKDNSLFPTLCLANLVHLRQHASVDLYEDEVLRHAQLIVVDHLGGEGYWPYGMERLQAMAQQGCGLVLLSGDHDFDENLLRKSNIPADICYRLWQYLRFGGVNNANNMLMLCQIIWEKIYQENPILHFNYSLKNPFFISVDMLQNISPPQPVAHVGIYHPNPNGLSLGYLFAKISTGISHWESATKPWCWQTNAPVVLLILYRAHVLAANMRVFEELMQILLAHNLNPLPLVVRSLKDEATTVAIDEIRKQLSIQIVINTTAFAANSELNHTNNEQSAKGLAGDAPVLQAIVSGSHREAWLANPQGLGPRDVAMHIALPEVDGRILTRAISFKSLARRSAATQCDLVHYEGAPTHMQFVAELASHYVKLRQLAPQQRRLAIILASYPNRSAAQWGAGVGLDTPASVIAILKALHQEGYCIHSIPENGTELMQLLQSNGDAIATQSLSIEEYLDFFHELTPQVRDGVIKRWGLPEHDPHLCEGKFPIMGLQLGDKSGETGGVFVGLQPARWWDNSLSLEDIYNSYHDPNIPPPHHYIAFYVWLRRHFGAHAMVHCGKHGNLEWLPGKSVALSDSCWPQLLMGPLPHIYPFIVNDPGEGAQAKRRTHATLIGHLMPPVVRAEIHGPLRQIEQLADEYYTALSMDTRRAQVLRGEIVRHAIAAQLHRDLGWNTLPQTAEAEDALIAQADAWLCALKDSQIRDGLHVFGQDLRGDSLIQTVFALLSQPSAQYGAGLLQTLAADLQLHWGDEGKTPFDPSASDVLQRPWTGEKPLVLDQFAQGVWRTGAHTRERLVELALHCLRVFLMEQFGQTVLKNALQPAEMPLRPTSSKVDLGRGWGDFPQTLALLRRAQMQLLPQLMDSGRNEMQQFLRACAGRFVPAGPSGAPTRGRWDVLPTGRNFFTVDPRAVPTPTSWQLARQSAEVLVQKYLQDEGDYPRAMGLNVWGTATMRTGGEDFAMALALIGARPRWGEGSGRVEDFEIVPIAALGRPRVDVTLRASGFFRDAFGHLLELFEVAVAQISQLNDETETDNPIRAKVLERIGQLQAHLHLDEETAQVIARQRVFAPRAGTFGSGMGHLLDSGNWQQSKELADAWMHHSAFNWRGEKGAGIEDLRTQIQRWDLIVQHLDNPEADMLDGSEHAQFMGAMASAAASMPVEAEGGKGQSGPRLYVLDDTRGHAPRVRELAQEMSRIVRVRLTNPRWQAAIQRHGYKGGFEILNAIEAVFAFAATTGAIRDDQFHAISHNLLLNEQMNDFLRAHNPHALRQGCERMLEAATRGLWRAPDGDTIEALRTQLLDMEDELER